MTRKDKDWLTRVPITVVTGALWVVCASSMALHGATGSAKERSVWRGVYTEAQAIRGKEVFVRACAECHSEKLGDRTGDGTTPSLIGEDFSFRWNESSIVDLFDTVRQTMPEAAPNSLSPQEYADVTAYLLELNEYPAGAVELDYTEREILGQIFIDEGPCGD